MWQGFFPNQNLVVEIIEKKFISIVLSGFYLIQDIY